ncbi:MAG: ABC transporter substrate-binding protein, partial [Bacteroidales bacterium]|nr:ABC transporter substrate-binding protein [Bacteroidales bacterium]
MKRIAVKLFSLFLFFCLTACSNTYADEVKIGVLSPNTGPFASGGESLKHSLQIAVENLNNKGGVLGKKIVLISYDTEGRVDKAKVEALKLIEKDKVSAIIGAYLTEETVVVNEVCALKKVINIVPIAASSEITDNVASNYNR